VAIAAASVYGVYRCNGLLWVVNDVSEMGRVAESRVIAIAARKPTLWSRRKNVQNQRNCC